MILIRFFSLKYWDRRENRSLYLRGINKLVEEYNLNLFDGFVRTAYESVQVVKIMELRRKYKGCGRIKKA